MAIRRISIVARKQKAAVEFSADSALATIERIESQCKRARSLLARPKVTPQLVFIILENISSEALRAVD